MLTGICAVQFFLLYLIENKPRAFYLSENFVGACTKLWHNKKSRFHQSATAKSRLFGEICHGQIIQSRRTRQLLMSVTIPPFPLFSCCPKIS